VTKILQKLEAVYTKLDPMKMTRGNLHQYLGMTIDYHSKGEVRITMYYNFIKKMIIDELPEDMIGTKPTPAPEYLFKMDNPDAIPLTKARSEEFHHITAKMLYLGNEDVPIYN